MRKLIFNFIGGASLSLGVLGIFLPLLPTTCFILLASWAFAKSSPTFHNWLYHKSPFAKAIQDWELNRVIPTRVKWIATSSIALSYVLTMLLIDNIYLLSGIGVGLLGLAAFLLSKPSETCAKASYISSRNYSVNYFPTVS